MGEEDSGSIRTTFETLVGCAQIIGIIGVVISVIALIVAFLGLGWAITHQKEAIQVVQLISGEPTATPVVPTDTPTREPTHTPTPTNSPTWTPSPTHTPTPKLTDTPTSTPLPPTGTPLPTPTYTPSPIPTPTPMPRPLPFEDTFDLRLNPEWKSIIGTWRVVDGHLTADPGDEWRRILIGDPGWTNYAIDVDIWSRDWFYPAQIIVRAQDTGYMAFETNSQDSDWFLFSNGDARAIAHSNDGTYDVPGGGRSSKEFHFRVEVNSDIYTAYLNGVKLLQVQDGTFPAGQVGLAFRTGVREDEVTWFDNFRVTELP